MLVENGEKLEFIMKKPYSSHEKYGFLFSGGADGLRPSA